MNSKILVLLAALAFSGGAWGDETFDDAMKRATLDYGARLRAASEELIRTRNRVAAEKLPFLQEMRAAENRIIAAQMETMHLETGRDEAGATRRKLLKEFDELRKASTYFTTLAHDSLKAGGDALAPGESQFLSDRFDTLQQQLDDTSKGPNVGAALDVVEFLLGRTRDSVGGYRTKGKSIISGTNQLVAGTFAFVGPETYFRPELGGAAGTVRIRQGASYPVTYPLPSWKPDDATAFFEGRPATLVADSSDGKALRLRETSGTWWAHVKKGGVVAYAILGVGVVALLLIASKIRDLSKMSVDLPADVKAFLAKVAAGSPVEARAELGALRATTRELFETGLKHLHEPESLLEQRLQAVLLGQRLHFEQRLPLLAVIATAAPLMGLLGTVVGMVKTFALITVFGTGNAGKLSSGISEVLVSTELGLAVAIPSLVVHGFLAHRIHKNLALLERHALEFVTAAGLARAGFDPKPNREVVTA